MPFKTDIDKRIAINRSAPVISQQLNAIKSAKNIDTWKKALTELGKSFNTIIAYFDEPIKSRIVTLVQDINLCVIGRKSFTKQALSDMVSTMVKLYNEHISDVSLFPQAMLSQLTALDAPSAAGVASSVSSSLPSTSAVTTSAPGPLSQLMTSLNESLISLQGVTDLSKEKSYAYLWFQLICVLEKYRLFASTVDVSKSGAGSLLTNLDHAVNGIVKPFLRLVATDLNSKKLSSLSITKFNIEDFTNPASLGTNTAIFSNLEENLNLLHQHDQLANQLFQAFYMAIGSGAALPQERRISYLIACLSLTKDLQFLAGFEADFNNFLEEIASPEQKQGLITLLESCVNAIRSYSGTKAPGFATYQKAAGLMFQRIKLDQDALVFLAAFDHPATDDDYSPFENLYSALTSAHDPALINKIYEKLQQYFSNIITTEDARDKLMQLIRLFRADSHPVHIENMSKLIETCFAAAQKQANDSVLSADARINALMLTLTAGYTQKNLTETVDSLLVTCQTLFEASGTSNDALIDALQSFASTFELTQAQEAYVAFIKLRLQQFLKPYTDKLETHLEEARAEIAVKATNISSLTEQLTLLQQRLTELQTSSAAVTESDISAITLDQTTEIRESEAELELKAKVQALQAQIEALNAEQAQKRDAFKESLRASFNFAENIMRDSVAVIIEKAEYIENFIASLKQLNEPEYTDYAEALATLLADALQIAAEARQKVLTQKLQAVESASSYTADATQTAEPSGIPVPPPPPAYLLAFLEQGSKATSTEPAKQQQHRIRASALQQELSRRKLDSSKLAALDKKLEDKKLQKTTKKAEVIPGLGAHIEASKARRKQGGAQSSSSSSEAPASTRKVVSTLDADIVATLKAPAPNASSSAMPPFLAQLQGILNQVFDGMTAGIAMLAALERERTATNDALNKVKGQPFPTRQDGEKSKAYDERLEKYKSDMASQSQPLEQALGELQARQTKLTSAFNNNLITQLGQLNAGCDICYVADVSDIARDDLSRPMYVFTSTEIYFIPAKGGEVQRLELSDAYVRPPVVIPLGRKPSDADLEAMNQPITETQRAAALAKLQKSLGLSAGASEPRALTDTDVGKIGQACGHAYQNAAIAEEDNKRLSLIQRLITAEKDPQKSQLRVQTIRSWLNNSHALRKIVALDSYLKDHPGSLTAVDDAGLNVLQIAINANELEVVQYLLWRADIGTAIKALTEDGLTVLHLAALLPPIFGSEPNQVYALLAGNLPQGLNADAKSKAEIAVGDKTLPVGLTAAQMRVQLYPTERVITSSNVKTPRNNSKVATPSGSSSGPSYARQNSGFMAPPVESLANKVKLALSQLQADTAADDDNYNTIANYIAKSHNFNSVTDKTTNETLLHRLVAIGHEGLINLALQQEKKAGPIINTRTTSDNKTALDMANDAATGENAEKYSRIAASLVAKNAKAAAELSAPASSVPVPGPTTPTASSTPVPGSASGGSGGKVNGPGEVVSSPIDAKMRPVAPPKPASLRASTTGSRGSLFKHESNLPPDFVNNALLCADRELVTAGLTTNPGRVNLQDTRARGVLTIVLEGVRTSDATLANAEYVIHLLLDKGADPVAENVFKHTSVINNPSIKTIFDAHAAGTRVSPVPAQPLDSATTPSIDSVAVTPSASKTTLSNKGSSHFGGTPGRVSPPAVGTPPTVDSSTVPSAEPKDPADLLTSPSSPSF